MSVVPDFPLCPLILAMPAAAICLCLKGGPSINIKLFAPKP